MRRTILLQGFLAATAGVSPGLDIAKQPTTRDAATHDQLVKQARPQLAPGMPLSGVSRPAVSQAWKPESLLARSSFLSQGGMATMVPKGSILHVPAAHAGRVGLSRGASVVTWAEFFAANRGWIQTLEVTRAQAGGKSPIAESTLEAMKTSSYLIVATMQGGPISVLPPKATNEVLTKP